MSKHETEVAGAGWKRSKGKMWSDLGCAWQIGSTAFAAALAEFKLLYLEKWL